jgi:hypothetical protein
VSQPDDRSGRADDEQVPVRLELLLMRPQTRADRGALERLLHASFVEIGASGRRWAREAVVDEMLTSSEDYVAPEVLDLADQRLADGVVLVTYSTRRLDSTTFRTSVWLHTEVGWQVVLHQATPAASG